MKTGGRGVEVPSSAEEFGCPEDTYTGLGSVLKKAVYQQVTSEELALLALWEAARPPSLRAFDQIPMYGIDLLCQVKVAAPLLTGKRVVFVGDHDGTSLLLGLLSSHRLLEGPEQMTLLDFDDRLLEIGSLLAHRFKFSDRFTSRSYNVFDPLPRELDKDFDAFYTNPPYGASNSGASARLFITRGCELTKGEKAEGYILLPEDQKRSWTRTAMLETQRFLTDHNWVVTACVPQLHRYHLDDDKGLKSSFLCVAYGAAGSPSLQMPWQGRAVEQTEIPHFYGKGVSPPFPRYLALDRHENSSLDNLSEGEKS